MACDREGTIYKGAFGERTLGSGQAMTLDTVGWIAWMTKAVTSVAAVQCAERGQIDLDALASKVVPAIGEAQVLTGFDANGKPTYRAPRRPVTLRHLLTHSAGSAMRSGAPNHPPQKLWRSRSPQPWSSGPRRRVCTAPCRLPLRPARARARRCPGLQAQVREDLLDHRLPGAAQACLSLDITWVQVSLR
jgi:CubicO group peptidase (beta-lactamase class C family)